VQAWLRVNAAAALQGSILRLLDRFNWLGLLRSLPSLVPPECRAFHRRQALDTDHSQSLDSDEFCAAMRKLVCERGGGKGMKDDEQNIRTIEMKNKSFGQSLRFKRMGNEK
jgi:hypothetical protein